MRIAFVTYAKLPNLTDDDQLVMKYLVDKDISVSPVLWDDATINWQEFEAIVIRSTWDYFERPVEFNQWLDKLETLGCNVLNPLSVIKWNQDKNYFDDFSNRGILLPAYIICQQNSGHDLKKIMDQQGWHKAVVKPAISGGAYHTWVTSSATAVDDQLKFAVLLQKGDVIVQTFVDEIITKGELSLIFFNKHYSHAICKKAKSGDFRVQTQYGGTTEAIIPDNNILNQATELLNNIPEQLLYARIDGVVTDDGTFMLMEAELIEPTLSVYTNEKACDNFYQALIKILAGANSARDKNPKYA